MAVKESDSMTDEKKDEFIIKSTEDAREERDGLERELIIGVGKMMKIQSEQRRLGLLMSTLGMTKRICEEERDASTLFQKDDRTCELFGMPCTHPTCYTCNLVMLYHSRNKVCATLENVGKVYQVSTDWSYDEEEDGGEDSEGPPQDTS